ncbi:cyclic-di-AMP receptor [Salsuginibacillus kocurii]|uniref:cyclic-di-AMP receptor n=1 Tax=Salsuginibacillus kocurii TaxID=427078 RepID=UPI00036B9BFE|nr:cyclic-di-AMP receptor [Salsuginibacillus kocurii]
MKVLVVVVEHPYVSFVEEQVQQKGFRMTELSSSGNFFKRGSTTFLFGINDEELSTLRSTLQQACEDCETKKGLSKPKRNEHRYTSFLINASEGMEMISKFNSK